MRIRFVLALLALGGAWTPSFAERPKTQTAPDTPETPPMLTMPPDVAPPAPVGPSPIVQVRMTGKVTTATRQEARSFAVADLIIPIPGMNGDGAIGRLLTESAPAQTNEKQLIRQIMTHVTPEAWQARGGQATIEYLPLGHALVVNASQDVMAKVEAYLETLRKKLDTQIVVETYIATVGDDFFERHEFAKLFDLKDAPNTKAKVVYLKNAQFETFMERLQGDKRATVLSSPKMTAFDGQECQINVGEERYFLTGLTVNCVGEQLVFVPKNERFDLGLKMLCKPQIAPDGTHVNLDLHVRWKQLAETPVALKGFSTPVTPMFDSGRQGKAVPFTQYLECPKIAHCEVKEHVTCASGQTVLLYGGKTAVKSTKHETLPVLRGVPVVSALFSKDTTETHIKHYLVMVKSRIIKPDAAEESEVPPPPDRLTELLKAYHLACRGGKTDEARRLAIECLTIDPKCFGK